MHPNARPIRILLVDDHPIVRAGYRCWLERKNHLHIIAEADNGESGYQLYEQYQPDVVVMDLVMPGQGGMMTIQRLCSRYHSVRILVFSMHEEPIFAEQALAAGAYGYVTKLSGAEVLADAIEQVARGKIYLSTDISHKLALHKLSEGSQDLTQLSAREFEIFRLLAEGHSTAEIAEMLNISEKTVANYYTRIRQKLNVNNTAMLIRLAIRQGIVQI